MSKRKKIACRICDCLFEEHGAALSAILEDDICSTECFQRKDQPTATLFEQLEDRIAVFVGTSPARVWTIPELASEMDLDAWLVAKAFAQLRITDRVESEILRVGGENVYHFWEKGTERPEPPQKQTAFLAGLDEIGS